MDKIITFTYWFDLLPLRWQKMGVVVLSVGVFLVVLGIVLRLLLPRLKYRPARAVSRRLANMFSLIGVLVLFYWFFRDQHVPFFAARFWLGLIIISALVWLSVIIRYWFKKVAWERELVEKERQFDRYLPHKK